jgi:hypothetical protein
MQVVKLSKLILFGNTIKPEYNDHPRDPKIVVFVDRWSLFRGSIVLLMWKTGRQDSGRCKQVVVSSVLTVYQIKFKEN